MNRRLLLTAGIAGYLGARRLRNRARAHKPQPIRQVTSEGARGLVEAALGRRSERRSLSIEFARATVTSWELLIDGPVFFPRLLGDIEAATSDVHVIIFGFKPSEIGDRFRELLVRKARQGVHTRLIVEGAYSQPRLGSWGLYRSLVRAGVEVVANQGAFFDLDGPIGRRRIDWRFDDFGHFDHRKIVVIDGRVAYVGGPGIEDHYADDRFHDVMLRLEGPIVAQLQAVFLLSWHFQGGPLPRTRGELDRFFPAPTGGNGIEMQILLNNPGERYLPIATAFAEAIGTANRRLYVINPYLADRSLLKGIVAAGRRGTDVHVIVPADPLSLPAKAAVRHWFAPLRDAGVDVREHPQMAHAKVVVADDTVLAGTANLDALSLRRNWELQLRAIDAGFADHVARELFDRDIALSLPARMPAGSRQRALNAAMSAASPLL
jgi:cardiolipin synthase